ncbi:Calcineurin-like_phosphoesterase [Hexamita inflata]|uniref:Calcineurin-like_phosphoesterase n=1 Tax=Hexamita inflata TaxID=28002 RepID=A0ABP1GI95_9EUKA
MIKVTAISDLHGKQSKIQHLLSGGDILFCTGDITPIINRTIFAVLSFLKWFDAQNYTYKILIGGNNDSFLQRHEKYIRALIAKKYSSVTYLNDEQIQLTIRNRPVSIFGTPHSINGTHRAFVLNSLQDQIQKLRQTRFHSFARPSSSYSRLQRRMPNSTGSNQHIEAEVSPVWSHS